MKYLKHIHESEKTFDFGYEREIIEDFIEEMNDFGIESFMVIHSASGSKFMNFDDILKNNISPIDGSWFINIQGKIKKDADFGNISEFKRKDVLAKDQYDYIKGLIDDLKDKMEDLTSLKIIEAGLHADIRYYINRKKSEELYSNLRYVITTRFNKSMKSK